MVWIEFELLIINSPFVKNNKGVRSFAVPLIGSKLTEGYRLSRYPMAESAFYRPICESDLIVLIAVAVLESPVGYTYRTPSVLNALFGTVGGAGFTTYREKR